MSNTKLRDFAVKLTHDSVDKTIHAASKDLASALTTILRAERVPLSDVLWARQRPVCDYCTEPATGYVKAGGRVACDVHARDRALGHPGALDVKHWVDAFGRCEWIDTGPDCQERKHFRVIGQEGTDNVAVIKMRTPYCERHASEWSESRLRDTEASMGN